MALLGVLGALHFQLLPTGERLVRRLGAAAWGLTGPGFWVGARSSWLGRGLCCVPEQTTSDSGTHRPEVPLGLLLLQPYAVDATTEPDPPGGSQPWPRSSGPPELLQLQERLRQRGSFSAEGEKQEQGCSPPYMGVLLHPKYTHDAPQGETANARGHDERLLQNALQQPGPRGLPCAGGVWGSNPVPHW